MGIVFSTAQNGSETCSGGNILLHSAYNPEREAERFVNSAECSYNPSFIVVTEPALSYCSPFLRRKFPGAEIFAVRYDGAFSSRDKLWDKIFSVHNASEPLSDVLFAELGEEGIFSTLFLSWEPSSRAFPDTDRFVWNEIKKVVLKSRDILYTRSFFGSRWTSNIFSFCRYISKISVPAQKGSCPVVVTASGQSLSGALPLLRKYRQSFFLIAVSSSLSVLLHNGIHPDMCISTDGGYYAGKHLTPYEVGSCSAPLALSAESFCAKRIISGCTVIPLSYGDGLESALLSYCGIPAAHAERNGTVSGTAAEFALDITSGPVFLCGLDLNAPAGYQHAQPNCIEVCNSSFDNRTVPKEGRISASRFSSQSLSVYSGWFKSLPAEKTKRLFRLSDHFKFADTLGSVADTDFDFFADSADGRNVFPAFTDANIPPQAELLKSERQFFENNKSSNEWLHSVFPAEYLGFMRPAGGQDAEAKKNSLLKRNDILLSHLERILYE